MAAKTSVKLDSSLCHRAGVAAAQIGYSSLEEFLEHALEKELAQHEQAEEKSDLRQRLKGLGYLD